MKNQKRGKNISIVGLFLQAIITVVMLILWRNTGSNAIYAGMWLSLGGVLTWLFTSVLFYSRQLEMVEKLEQEALSQASDSSIFEGQDADALKPAKRRVEVMKKYFVPIIALMLAAYNAAIGYMIFIQLKQITPEVGTTNAPAAVFLVLLGFAGFLFSRYATGMSHAACWRLLRAPGSFLLVCVIFAALQFVSIMSIANYPYVDLVVAFVVSFVMIAYSFELVLNLILNVYRPRLPGQEFVPCYESRIFNIVAQPSRVGNSIADTLNYQFGFEVSKTWFYKLISKAIFPLILFSILVLAGMSTIVITKPGEQTVIKHMGRIQRVENEGLSFKLPWPLGTVDKFHVGKIHNVEVGIEQDSEEKVTKSSFGQEVILWKVKHGYKAKAEQSFLVAQKPTLENKQDRETESEQSLKVSIIKFVVIVQYQIDDVVKFGYKYSDTHKLIEKNAQQIVTKYCASATLDERLDGKAGQNRLRPQALMTSGRTDASLNIKRLLAQKLKKLDVGVKIRTVGIMSAHPPIKAVQAWEDVNKADSEIDIKRYAAEANVASRLAKVSGDPDLALEICLELKKLAFLTKLAERDRKTYNVAEAFKAERADAKKNYDNLRAQLMRDKLLGKIHHVDNIDTILQSKGDKKLLAEMSEEIGNRFRLAINYRLYMQELFELEKAPSKWDYKALAAKAKIKVETLFALLQGQPAIMIYNAQASAWEKIQKANAKVIEAQNKAAPYLASPDVYKTMIAVKTWNKILKNSKLKWFNTVDPNLLRLRFNWQPNTNVITEALDESLNKGQE